MSKDLDVDLHESATECSEIDQDKRAMLGLPVKRRSFLQGATATAVAAPLVLPGLKMARAADGPVKIGHIEDLSGNLAVYGVQKFHAAQLAVKEINEGKTLKGGPVGSGGLGAMANFASAPPVMGHGEGDLKYVDDGGERSGAGMSFVEDEDVLVDSGESGLLGREVELLGPDGQSNNNIWQQLTRRLIQEDEVDCLVAGFTSAEREAIRPIVDQFKQLYIYTNQYEGGVADSNTFCTGAICEQQVIPVVDYMIRKFGPRPLLMAYLTRYTSEQARRHEVRPGITGWAQVNGRNAISWEEKFAHDVWYVDNLSPWLDLKILAMTLVQVVRGRGISASEHATAPPFMGTPPHGHGS